MLFPSKLLHLADEGRSSFAQKIAERVGPQEVHECGDGLRDLVLLMPPLLKRLRRLWEDPQLPSEVKNLSGYIVTYLYHSQDVIPEDEDCLFGYVDDAYLIASTYLQAADFLSHDHPLKRDQERQLILRTRELVSLARRVIPREAEMSEGMAEALVAGDDQEFQRILASAPEWVRAT